MRIAHVADLHLGMVTHSRTDPETGLPSRLLDIGRCWHRACEIAVDRGADAMIVAGDTFHGPNPDSAALNLFAVGLRVLEDAGIPTAIITGNHDRAPHPNRQSVIEVFASDMVQVASRPEVLDVGGIRVATLPSVSRHQLMANRPGTTRTMADEALVEGLVEVLAMLRATSPDILTAHWPVQGTVLGAEKDIAIIPEPMIPMAEIAGPWSYAALGHIHHGQDGAVEQTHWAYAGSIDRMNFGEEGDPKVVVLMDIESNGDTTLRVEELPARRFVTLNIDEEGGDVFVEEDVCDAIVRVRGTDSEGVEWTATRAEQSGAHIVRREVRRPEQIRSRAAEVTEELSTGDALDQWFKVRDVDEEERPALRELAKHLIEEATT